MKTIGWVLSVALAAGCLFIIAKVACIDFRMQEEVVSGIVYDASFNEMISGNTNFKIRAAAEMYADKDTSATYCLPMGSKYEELIRKAAGDKTVKVKVTARKFFEIKNTVVDCPETVEVEEITEEK